jgi:hypothetical protein
MRSAAHEERANARTRRHFVACFASAWCLLACRLLNRCVRGILFVDYVKMVRGKKSIDWSPYLDDVDREVIAQPIDLDAWYPMETFERLGLGIVREVAHAQLIAVRMWGRFQLDFVRTKFPTIVAEGDPRDTMMRFHAMRRAFFDYDALDVVEVLDDSATVAVQYRMGAEAEEAACWQTLGFCERLVELAGAKSVVGKLAAQSWNGAPRTLIDLKWT